MASLDTLLSCPVVCITQAWKQGVEGNVGFSQLLSTLLKELHYIRTSIITL